MGVNKTVDLLTHGLLGQLIDLVRGDLLINIWAKTH